MTAFLRLNGIPQSVADDKASHSNEETGSSGRAVDGTYVTARRVVKNRWQFSTTLMDSVTAKALRSLVLGRGHNWDFETSLYSSKGIALAGGARSSTQKKFGTWSMSIAAGGHAAETASGYDYNTLPWTAAFWWYDGAWHHYVEDSSGRQWKDGVVVGSPTLITDFSTGELDFLNVSGGTRYLDDVWISPVLWPDTWPAYVAARTSALAASPNIEADGLAIEGNTLTTVRGEVGESNFRQGVWNGVWTPNLEAQAFTLWEV